MLMTYELSQYPDNELFLPFKLDTDIFAVESRYVSAISNMLLISPLPGTPEYLKGIAKVEGQIIPVIDMRLKMCKEYRPYNDDTQIIMLSLEGVQSGLIVDTLIEGRPVYPEYLDGYVSDRYPGKNHYFKGSIKINGSPAMILDCKKLLMEDEIFDLAQLVS